MGVLSVFNPEWPNLTWPVAGLLHAPLTVLNQLMATGIRL